MPLPKYDPETYQPQQSYSAKQLSRYDMQVAGIVVYVVAITVLFAVALVLMLFGNEVTTAHAARRDNGEVKNKVAELTQLFPTPRVHAEDTNDDIADLHAHEDLLLENYTWADGEHAKVRIPIERAMQLMAQRGLPTAASVGSAPLMTGERRDGVAVPLTAGFARTENEQARLKTAR